LPHISNPRLELLGQSGKIKVMDDGLFNLDDIAPQNEECSPIPLSPAQRQGIRELFAQLGVTEARAQFELVAELTGVRIASVAELGAEPANVLLQMLRSRVARCGHDTTGNAWADRDEDTWIDRL
jgi:DNA polymerase-3 subunit epsilon